MPSTDLAALVTQGGAIAALAFFVIAFIKGWVVPGGVHQALTKDRDDWKNIAMASIAGAEKAVRLAERRRAPGSVPSADH